MSKGFYNFLGLAELAGAFGVTFGVLTQLAAIGLVLIMLGAIQQKIFVWRTGFWGKSGTNGWSYDTMLVVMTLIVVTTGGGNISLGRYFGLPALSFVAQSRHRLRIRAFKIRGMSCKGTASTPTITREAL